MEGKHYPFQGFWYAFSAICLLIPVTYGQFKIFSLPRTLFFTFPWVSFYSILYCMFYCGQTSPLTRDFNIEAFFQE